MKQTIKDLLDKLPSVIPDFGILLDKFRAEQWLADKYQLSGEETARMETEFKDFLGRAKKY